jgi:hypothetical protein
VSDKPTYLQRWKGRTFPDPPLPMMVYGPPSARTLALDELLPGPRSAAAQVWGVPRWRVVAWKVCLRIQAWWKGGARG